MGLYLGELIIGRLFASEICGAYFREGLLSEFYGILTGMCFKISIFLFLKLIVELKCLYIWPRRFLLF